MSGDGIQLLLRDRGEVHRFPVFQAELTQPHPGVDLIDYRIFGPSFHFIPPPTPYFQDLTITKA
jgi:hypothetical protein